MADGLRVALSALQAQRRALEVHGNNVANATTVGYSRQRVGLDAVGGNTVPSIFSTSTGAGGVRAGDVTRIRDAFLDARSRDEARLEAELAPSVDALRHLESVLGEPSDTGLGGQLADFLAAWDDLANRPGDLSARTAVLERAKTLVEGFAAVDASLASYGASAVDGLRSNTTEVNGLATATAELNQRIQRATVSGLDANDLLDQRARVLDRLAALTGAEPRDAGNGVVDVFLGSIAFVRGATAQALDVTVDGAGVAAVVWHADQRPAVTSGALTGALNVVNGVVPRYRASFTTLAGQLRTEVNTAHRAGFGLDGASGRDFFGAAGPLAVDPAMLADPRRLGASSSATAAGDGSVARGLAALSATTAAHQALVVGLAVESQGAGRRLEIQELTASTATAASEAARGVNLDEEMVEMMGAQHAYEAAARLMTAVDQTLDTLINRTGLVGR